MARNILLFVVTTIFLSCQDESKIGKVEKDIIVGHTKSQNVKSQICLYAFDSALAYSRVGDYIKSEKLLRRCDEIEPNNTTILNALGVSCFANGDTITALNCYSNALKTDSSNAEAYLNTGYALQRQQKYLEAIEILKLGYIKTTIKQCTHYEICLNLAITYYSMDSCSQTLEYLALAKRSECNEPQVEQKIKEIEPEIIKYCDYHKTHKKYSALSAKSAASCLG